MKIKVMCCVAACALACGAAFAETLTISTSAVSVDGSKWYSGVEVTCASTISGTLNLEDGATVVVSSGTAAFTAGVTLGTTSGGKVTIAPASGATATFTGCLTGPAAVDINGDGSVYFTSDTSDFDGNLTVTKGSLHAKGTQPFGSTTGYTYIRGSATALLYFDGVTTDEDLRISDTGNYNNMSIWFTDDCTFNGPFTASNYTWEWWRMSTGKYITFNGTFSGFNCLLGDDKGGQPIVTWNCPLVVSTVYWKYGTLNFNKPLNLTGKSGYDHLRVRGGTTYYLNCADVFGDATYSSRIYWEDKNALPHRATFNLVSNDQHFAFLQNDVFSTNTVFTSANDVVLHLKSDAAVSTVAQNYCGTITGKLGLSVEGARPLTLSGKNTTSGTLALANGAQVTLAAGSAWAGGISIAHGTADTEKLTLDSGDVSVSDLWIGGERVAGGTYGSDDSSAAHKMACFGGTGVMTVPSPKLEITGDYVVPADGVTCSGVRVTGAATISGGMIVVESSAASIDIAANATFSCPLQFGVNAGDNVKIVPAADVSASFTGVLSGSAPIEILAETKTGSVTFSGANTFDGNLTITRGIFHATSDGAFGSTAGYTYMLGDKNGTCRLYLEGIATSEELRISQGGEYGVDNIWLKGHCTFNGPVRGPEMRAEWWRFDNDATVVFNGAFTDYSDLMFGDRGIAQSVTWNGAITTISRFYCWKGTYNFNAPITWRTQADRNNWRVRGGATYNINCANVLGTADYSSRIHWNAADAASAITVFNFAADDHVAYFSEGRWSGSTTLHSEADGATLHLESATTYVGSDVPSTQTFNGVVTGKLGLSVEGALPLTLGGVSTTSGALTLTNGADVTFAAGAQWKGIVRVMQGAGTAEKLTLSDDMTVGGFETNGVALAAGTYGSTAAEGVTVLPFLKGSGKLYVSPEIKVITGDYVVASAGETYGGLEVQGAATISGGPITFVGASTLSLAANATFDVPIVLDAPSCVIIPAPNVTSDFTRIISGRASIVVRGEDVTGVVNFRGENTFDGNLTIERGAFHAYGDKALGSTQGYTYFLGTGSASAKRKDNEIHFHAMNTAENVRISGGFGTTWWQVDNIFFYGTNVFTGAWTATASVTEFGWIFMPASDTSFNGSLTGFADFFGHNSSVGHDGSPQPNIRFGGTTSFIGCWYGNSVPYYYNAPVSCSELRFRGGTHYLKCANAFSTGTPFLLEGRLVCKMLVDGYDQSFAYIGESGANYSELAEITSSSAQTVTLTGTHATTYCGKFTGNVNLTCAAASTVTLYGTNTTSGVLALGNGAQGVLETAAKWDGAVRIGASSSLTLKGVALKRRCPVSLTGDATLVAPAGVTQCVGTVTVDGATIPTGVYSATSGDERYRAHFPGAGVVHVLGGGMTLLVR